MGQLSLKQIERVESVLNRQANDKALTIGEVIVSLEDLLKTISPEAWEIYRKIDHLSVREYAQTIDYVYKVGYEDGRNDAFNNLGLWDLSKDRS